MTEIIWTNCADEMPTDDKTRIIVWIYEGCIIDHGTWFARYARTLIEDQAKWAIFTPEKWKELNNGRD